MATESQSSSQEVTFEEHLRLVKSLALSKEGIHWDEGRWLVAALDELEKGRRYWIRLANDLLLYLDSEPLLVQLKEAHTKGKGRADSPSPPSDLQKRLDNTVWNEVKNILDSKDSEAQRYWGMLIDPLHCFDLFVLILRWVISYSPPLEGTAHHKLATQTQQGPVCVSRGCCLY